EQAVDLVRINQLVGQQLVQFVVRDKAALRTEGYQLCHCGMCLLFNKQGLSPCKLVVGICRPSNPACCNAAPMSNNRLTDLIVSCLACVGSPASPREPVAA